MDLGLKILKAAWDFIIRYNLYPEVRSEEITQNWSLPTGNDGISLNFPHKLDSPEFQ